MTNVLITQLVVAVCAVVGLGAFLYLIAVPSIAARERVWERVVATVLSVYVLVVLVGIGVAAGIAVIWAWPQIT
jgi:hypothetical protein